MKAVVLAAGRGTRIRSITHGRPKCLLSVDHRTILDVQIESLFQAGVDDLTIVVGYQRQQIIHHVWRTQGLRMGRIRFVHNQVYASTNSMYSLALARVPLAGAGFLCVNADVLCHPLLVDTALASRADFSAVIDREFRAETTKVKIKDGRIVALEKRIPREEADGTLVGIVNFSPSGARRLFRRADEWFARGEFNMFFNDVLHNLAREGVPVECADSQGLPWAEIDDPTDWEFARTHVFPEIARFLDVVTNSSRVDTDYPLATPQASA